MSNAPITENDTLVPSPADHGDDERIIARFERARAVIEIRDAAGARDLVEGLHAADLADLVSALKADQRLEFVLLLGERFDFSALTDVDESVRFALFRDLPNELIAHGLHELSSDDAVFILEDLKEAEQQDILSRIPAIDRIALRRSLEYPEDTAGRRMQSDFIAVPPFWSVGQTIDFMREQQDLPEEFYELFVVNPDYHLHGTVALNRLLRTRRNMRINQIMSEEVHPIEASEDQEEVAITFERYDLVSAPVVDETGRLVGVLTVDDIVDVIQEEAAEDIKRLGGVGHEDISDTIVRTLRSRFVWLLVNLTTAILASIIIQQFDATIDHIVALAILMPIVASMGGNAGTQTLTITVRALATRDIGSFNARRVIRRETAVGFLNGLMFALITASVVWVWFASQTLAAVIAVAMVVNMVVAGLGGILIPMTLDRFSIDPAIASAVFLTTLTDVVGFFSFLGLAAWWYGIV